MSQELTLNLSFTCNNPSTGGGYSDNVRINSQYTQNAQGANAEVVSIPTSPTTISLSNLTTLGYAYFQNLDAANFITVGQQGVAISAPTQTSPSTSTSGGTLAAATYYYKITALSLGGETTPSGEQSQVTTGSTSTVTVNWNAVTGATGYNIYRSTSTGTEHLLTTVGAVTTYTDTGSLTPGSTSPPGSNTTSYQPFCKLKAGEVSLLRLEPGMTIQAKADTAAVELWYWVLND